MCGVLNEERKKRRRLLSCEEPQLVIRPAAAVMIKEERLFERGDKSRYSIIRRIQDTFLSLSTLARDRHLITHFKGLAVPPHCAFRTQVAHAIEWSSHFKYC